MAPMILPLSSDIRHHLLEPPLVATLIICMYKKRMYHFVDKRALYLIDVKPQPFKKLVRQVNLSYRKLLTVSHESQHSASLVSTITSSSGHSLIPNNRNVWDFSVKMFVIQLNKHCFNIWDFHNTLLGQKFYYSLW
jgi:hypothetical protein|tara:strand:- start:1975 stop:2382 length:408 start_codon:yes stop_codon:yes gene_type:complete